MVYAHSFSSGFSAVFLLFPVYEHNRTGNLFCASNRLYRGISELEDIFERGFIIVGSYILGASLGVISLFTSFGSYMGSSRSGGGKITAFLSTTPLFYRTEWLVDFFTSYISDNFASGLWLKLGFAPLAMLAIVLLLQERTERNFAGCL